MDRIALISDLHGNIPALEATLHDIKKRNIQRIFCLGDLVGKGPHSDRVVDICQEKCEMIIKGNWEDSVIQRTEHPLFAWYRERLGSERLDFLDNLPYTIDVCISGKSVRLFHASQASVHYRVFMHDPREKLVEMFANTDFTGDTFEPDVVGYGDIHRAYIMNFQNKTLFNLGSVGNPMDAPQASYAIIEGQYDSHIDDTFSIYLIRVPYDVDRAIQHARDADMPALEPYAHELRTAQYRGPNYITCFTPGATDRPSQPAGAGD